MVIERCFVGMKKPSEEELHEERDAVMRSEYFDPVERFPEKIDQFLDAINRVSFTLSTTCFNICVIWLKSHGYIQLFLTNS